MLKPNPDYIRELLTVINTSPYPDHMSMRVISIATGRAAVEIELKNCHFQPYGIVHGGVIATLIDTSTFWSVFMNVPEGDGLVNIDLKLNYLKTVTKGLLRAEGRAIRFGKSLSYAESKVVDAEGQLIAHGTSTLMPLAGRGLKIGTQKFLSD